MTYRRFRTQGGQFLSALFTSEGEFSTPAEVLAADLEAGYGLSGIEVVESAEDPWDGESDLIESPAPAPATNVNGFLLAAMSGLGLARGNALLAAWPTFTVALNAGNWQVALAVLGAAVQAQDMTADERAMLIGLMSEHGIPTD